MVAVPPAVSESEYRRQCEQISKQRKKWSAFSITNVSAVKPLHNLQEVLSKKPKWTDFMLEE